MNDTHPTIAVAELMRLLIDQHGLSYAAAWAISTQALAYTNPTCAPPPPYTHHRCPHASTRLNHCFIGPVCSYRPSLL